MADDMKTLKAQNKALRRAVRDLINTIMDVSVTGVDRQLHVSYDCDGQWGFRCTCHAHQAVAAAEELLEEEVTL